MRHLIEVSEIYRCDSERESEILISEAKADNSFLLKKYNNEIKEVKVKGEIEDTYFKVTLVKVFDNIKSPIYNTVSEYHLHHEENDDDYED